MERRGEPGLADRLAKDLGLGKVAFHGLVRKWRMFGTEDALAPYHQTTKRTPRIDKEISALLGDRIAQELARPGRDSDERIVTRVLEAWPSDMPAPARTTIRRRMTRDRAAMRTDTKSVTIATEGADAPGETLVVDHTALKVATDGEDGGLEIPTFSVVIDAFQNAVIGASLSRTGVTADCARAALAAAGRSVEDIGPEHLPLHVRPLIRMWTTFGGGWRDLVDDVSATRVHLSVRRDQKLAFGSRVHKMLAGRLGRFELIPRIAHRAPGKRMDGGLAASMQYIPWEELQDVVQRIVYEQRVAAFATASIAELGAGPEPNPGVLEIWRELAELDRLK